MKRLKMRLRRYPYWHRYFVRELEKDVDVSVVITGPRGNGKSTLTMWLMLWTEARLNNGVADVRPMLESLTWDTKEWINMMKEKYRYHAVGFEEFGNAATVEEVNNLVNQMLREIQSTNRHLNILKIFNLPGFVHMPPKIRTTTNYWINVLSRGHGKLYKMVPEEGPEQKPLHFYTLYLGDIYYSALPAKVYDLYKEVKKEVEQERYREAAVKIQDHEFKKLPMAEKRKRVARFILQLRSEMQLEREDGLKWGLIANELAKRWSISLSAESVKRWFKDVYLDMGWKGIEEIAH